MKITTALAVAFGLGALAACNNQNANNAEENVDLNATGTMEMNAENATENVDMNAMPTENAGNTTDNNTVTNNGY